MHPQAHVELARKLLRRIGEKRAHDAPARTALVDRARYTSASSFEAERARLFANVPHVVAHESELAVPGACVRADVAGVSLLVARGDDGVVRAFRNACRHRGTELLPAGEPCRKKAIVCPYHGWTYDLTGRRIHVPIVSAFAGREGDRDALSPAYAEARGGFIWASLAPFDAALHLGDLDRDLASLDLASHRVHRRVTREVRGNWKLIIDAFLDGYHIRHLHRGTVYRFFIDGASEAERVGPHVRAATARRTLREANESALGTADLRLLMTPSYVLFPGTVLVFHPDYVSVMTLSPLAPDRTQFTHSMLVPPTPNAAELTEHWDKSFALIDEGVFLSEDLATVEAIQRGLASTLDDTCLFGELELAATWFHESVDAAIATK